VSIYTVYIEIIHSLYYVVMAERLTRLYLDKQCIISEIRLNSVCHFCKLLGKINKYCLNQQCIIRSELVITRDYCYVLYTSYKLEVKCHLALL
jgi:hypothetical protein